MIDITNKKKTKRVARAQAFVNLNKEILEKIRNKVMPKGDVLECARIAGIMAAKNTPNIIPLCHLIGIEKADVAFVFKKNGIFIESVVRVIAKTGVEMEALTAVTVAALTIYDMCKMFSKAIEIQDIYLLEKRGGKSGVYKR